MTDSKRLEWLMDRKTYIGGSDIGCILGLSPYKTPLDIFLDKTTDRVDDSISEAAYWGNVFEGLVAKEYSNRTGLKIEKPEGVIRHVEHHFLGANIDRWVSNKEYVLECKTAHFLKSKEWGEEGTDEIPELYLCQVAYYAAICNVPKVDIAVLIGGQGFKTYTYLRNKEFENKLIRAACAFWNNYVLKGIPPEATKAEDILSLYPGSNGNIVKAEESIIQDIENLKLLKIKEKALIEDKAVLEMKIKSYIADKDSLVDEKGEVLVTWKSGIGKQVLDIKRLQIEHQGIYQQYLTKKEASRIFLIK